MNTQEMSRIYGVTIVVNGTPYSYEAHTAQRVAEILAGTLRVMGESDTMDSFRIY